MNLFGHDISFWISLVGATAIRIFTSPFHSIIRSAVIIVTSVFTAWVATDPVIDILRLDPAVYKAAVGAVIALTADGVVRSLIDLSKDPSKLIDLWKKFRSSGGQ